MLKGRRFESRRQQGFFTLESGVKFAPSTHNFFHNISCSERFIVEPVFLKIAASRADIEAKAQHEL